MHDLQLEIRVSVGGEPYRTIATGIRPVGGNAFFPSTSEPLPSELLEAFNRYLGEFDLTVGTWNYQIGNTTYKVLFTSASTNF
jgi:hypothetical protein